jgi:hypothetical protein
MVALFPFLLYSLRMKTQYLPPHPTWEPTPSEMPDFNSTRIDIDDRTDIMIEFATYFTVIQANPGGWRTGESNYLRSEHLTLESARMAAKKRYEDDPKKRGCLIYAVIQYSNRPIGSGEVIEGYPPCDSPYSKEARRAKKRGNPVPRSLRNMPEPGSLPPPQRAFEPTSEELDEIKRRMEQLTVVGKGGSKVAFKYRNRSRR